jgi:hypothetical protein
MEGDAAASWFQRFTRVWAWLAGSWPPLLVGVGARAWYFFLNDSFWRDESKLLLNVAEKSFAALLGPLDYEQELPIPLLWLYRLLYLAGAGGELPMRTLSLAASILTLLLFYFLARRMIKDRRAALFATWLLALAPGVILFAAMVKHYSIDMFVATCLLWLATPALTSTDRVPLSTLLWAAILAPWVSYPAIFVLGGIGVGLLLRSRTLGIFSVLRLLALTSCSIVLEVFGILLRLRSPDKLAVMARIAAALEVISNWWLWLFCQVFYAYLGPQLSLGTYYYPHAYYLNPFLVGVAILVLLGLWESKRQSGWSLTVALFGPLLLALTAYYLGLYWAFGRTLIFAVPGLYLLAGYGAVWLFRMVPWPRLLAVVLVILVLPCAKYSLEAFGRPQGGVREGLKYVAAHQQQGDLVFFDSYAAPTIAYYKLLGRPYARSLSYGVNPTDWIEGKMSQWQIRPEEVNGFIPRDERIWLVAETVDYARGPLPDTKPYWNRILVALERTHRVIGAYATNRVQVEGFEPR